MRIDINLIIRESILYMIEFHSIDVFFNVQTSLTKFYIKLQSSN